MTTTSRLMTLAVTALFAVSPAQAADSHKAAAHKAAAHQATAHQATAHQATAHQATAHQATAHQASAHGVDAEAALKKLQAGNARFVSRPESSSKATGKARKAAAHNPHPFAVVVASADPRTAPEIVFDQNIGDLFVLRTPGNLVDDHALGSIEYAAEHFGAKLIVVLGLKGCPMVQAAVNGVTAPGHMGGVVREIRPAVRAVMHDEGDVLVNAVNENVYRTANKISQRAHFGEAASSVRIVRAVYDPTTGKVEYLK